MGYLSKTTRAGDGLSVPILGASILSRCRERALLAPPLNGDQMKTYARYIRVNIDQTPSGMLHATSGDLPGLLVVEEDMETLQREIPLVIVALFKAQGITMSVSRAVRTDDDPWPWVALPDAHIAAFG